MGPSGIENEHGWTFTTIVAEADGTVVLPVTPTREAVPCPTYGVLSRRQHSWYMRRAMDSPWRGATVRLRVRGRRWFCDEADRQGGFGSSRCSKALDIEPAFAVQLPDLLRRRQLSARELAQLLLDQIDRVNPSINAVVELRRDVLLRAAEAADAVGGSHAPLHGVPMTIKDAFNVAGLHTTWGNPAFKDYVADSDATIVQRLQAAGAIVAGKTNVAFMLGDFAQTANPLYGTTRNPWNAALVPGGSSGGSAAALSAGMTFLEYASDVVGSIRIPASFLRRLRVETNRPTGAAQRVSTARNTVNAERDALHVGDWSAGALGCRFATCIATNRRT
jgi:hypothetical protein